MLDFMDNFAIYGDNTGLMTQGLYAEVDTRGVTLVGDPGGAANRVLACNFDGINNGQTSWRRVLSQSAATVGVAMRLWLPQLPGNNDAKTRHLEFRNNANIVLGSLIVNSTGALRFRINGAGDYVSAVPNITANGWWHIEVKYSHTGVNLTSFEIRVEGQTVLKQDNVAGPDFDVAQIAQSRDNINGDSPSYMKDFVVWNGLGATNNDFLGSVLVYSLVPDADAALNWTPSSGAAGYPILSAAPPNDGTFLTAGTPPPAAYEATLTNLPANVTSVRGVMAFVRATKSDGGDAFLQTGIVSNGATANGSNRPITITPTWWTDAFETDPSTGAAFTPAAVDGMHLKLNRTA